MEVEVGMVLSTRKVHHWGWTLPGPNGASGISTENSRERSFEECNWSLAANLVPPLMVCDSLWGGARIGVGLHVNLP